MPEEDAYITAQNPEQRADLIIHGWVTNGPPAQWRHHVGGARGQQDRRAIYHGHQRYATV